MVIRCGDLEAVAATEVEESFTVYDFFGDAPRLESLLFGKLLVNPFAFRREEGLKLPCPNVFGSPESKTPVTLDRQPCSSARSSGLDRDSHAVQHQGWASHERPSFAERRAIRD
jgi:hypothetical protein